MFTPVVILEWNYNVLFIETYIPVSSDGRHSIWFSADSCNLDNDNMILLILLFSNYASHDFWDGHNAWYDSAKCCSKHRLCLVVLRHRNTQRQALESHVISVDFVNHKKVSWKLYEKHKHKTVIARTQENTVYIYKFPRP